ncbi:hypothetical protein [Mycobacterium sp.]|uniref:hypothetical protein n=1 Tax=Mycobacterium sp. TaxID=1785 RepID=UPI003C77AA36
MAAGANQLGSVEHIVVLVLENRSLDHMLGFLYADSGNVSPATKQTHAAMPTLTTEQDYHDYIASRSAAWTAARANAPA